MSASPQPRLTPEEYLEIDRASEIRSEYFDGRMWAMSGASLAHARIVSAFSFKLGEALEGGPCEVTISDLRLRVSPEGLYTYPDLMVICNKVQLADAQNDTALNPTVIIEVLSKSTEAHDRGFKFTQYRQLTSLQEYALVSQNELRIELFRRQQNAQWLLMESAGPDAVCRFESLGCQVALAEIYRRVEFSDD